MERPFFCYSRRLKKALIANGFFPVCSGVNEHSKKKFWLFDGTKELNDYKNNKYQTERNQFGR